MTVLTDTQKVLEVQRIEPTRKIPKTRDVSRSMGPCPISEHDRFSLSVSTPADLQLGVLFEDFQGGGDMVVGGDSIDIGGTTGPSATFGGGGSRLACLRLSNVIPSCSFVNPTTGGSPFLTNS